MTTKHYFKTKASLSVALLIACFIAGTGVCFAQNAEKPVIPSGRTVLADMRINNPGMYAQYRSGRKMQRNGIILTGIGGGVFGMGAIFSIFPDTDQGNGTVRVFGIKIGNIKTDGDHSGLRKAGPVLMAAGGACLAVGLPVMIVGGKKKRQTFRDFKNQYYLPQPPSSYFQMNVSPNSVGIAYMF
jgi:hypothetical protein